MDNSLNAFKHLELIVGDSAESLTLKLRMIPFPYHYLKVWTDGKKHYAHINANKPFPQKLIEELAKIK